MQRCRIWFRSFVRTTSSTSVCASASLVRLSRLKKTRRLLLEEIVRTKERNQILHLCMDELNPDYREALYLTYFEEMCIRDRQVTEDIW